MDISRPRTKVSDQLPLPARLKSAWRGLIFNLCSQWRWGRRLHGGKWEEWWVDCCNAYVWLPVHEFHRPGARPEGCAIWDTLPLPRGREEYPI